MISSIAHTASLGTLFVQNHARSFVIGWLWIATAVLAAADKLREDRVLQRLAALFELDGQLLTA